MAYIGSKQHHRVFKSRPKPSNNPFQFLKLKIDKPYVRYLSHWFRSSYDILISPPRYYMDRGRSHESIKPKNTRKGQVTKLWRRIEVGWNLVSYGFVSTEALCTSSSSSFFFFFFSRETLVNTLSPINILNDSLNLSCCLISETNGSHITSHVSPSYPNHS